VCFVASSAQAAAAARNRENEKWDLQKKTPLHCIALHVAKQQHCKKSKIWSSARVFLLAPQKNHKQENRARP
jgi:hypothetical protein